jgi:hypothetical protein
MVCNRTPKVTFKIILILESGIINKSKLDSKTLKVSIAIFIWIKRSGKSYQGKPSLQEQALPISLLFRASNRSIAKELMSLLTEVARNNLSYTRVQTLSQIYMKRMNSKTMEVSSLEGTWLVHRLGSEP